jgi:hypothetical protein
MLLPAIGWQRCYRCRRPWWAISDTHDVEYAPGRGQFALCEPCIYDEHPAGCTFGGMTVGSLYWLVAEGCSLPHSDTCAWCGVEATTGFAGREPGHGDDDNHRFLVPACGPCAEEWTRVDPRWKGSDGSC